MWIIFLIEFVTVLLLFYILALWPRDMWDLRSPTRNWPCTPCIGRSPHRRPPGSTGRSFFNWDQKRRCCPWLLISEFSVQPCQGSPFALIQGEVQTGLSVLLAQRCLTLQSHGLCPRVWLCNPMDCTLPGSSAHGIPQARILLWVALSSSRGSSWPSGWTHVSFICRRMLYHRARGWQTGLDSAEFPHCKGTEGRIFALVGENQGMGFFFFFFIICYKSG